MDDLSRFCCQNPACPKYGVRDAGNLSVCDRYGKQKQYRLLYCNVCKDRFSERKGTPFFQAKLSPEKVLSVLEHINEGCGVRKTERLVGVHRDTVTRYSRLAGEHASKAHDELVAFPPKTEEVQFDEKWSFVAKKEKHCDRCSDPADDYKGECWDHVAFDPEHRLVVSVVAGKRTAENAETVVKDFHRRTGGRTMRLITTDEYPTYETAILEAHGRTVVPERTGRPGRPKGPYKVAPEDLCYATVRKKREKGRVEEIVVGAVFGTLEQVKAALKRSRVSRAINTAFIERYNGTDRNFNARKVRKT